MDHFKNKSFLIKVFILIVIALIILSGYLVLQSNKKKPSVFGGTISMVNSSDIVVNGVYKNTTLTKNSMKLISIKVDEKTRIEKTSFKKPTDGKIFYVDKLPKQHELVDFTVLKKDSENVNIGVEVELNRDILNNPVLVAKSIKYIAPQY